MEEKKRGIDYTNRFFDTGLAKWTTGAIFWWKGGGKFSRLTFVFVSLVFLLNLFLVVPFVRRDLTVSFSSSAFLVLIAGFFSLFGIHKELFFQFLAFIFLSLASVNVYLFARKMALRHELIAFLTTLLFLLPNPFWGKGSPLITAILIGDGAHALAFTFIPLLLLYAESFIEKGVPVWGVISALSTALIAIVSPFAAFNLIIFFIVLTIAQGFLGGFRIKLLRMLFLLFASFGLAFFWYHPYVIMKIMILSHVSLTMQKFWSVFPLLIPAIPVLGAVLFLVFDRREKLKPFFVGLVLSLTYLSLISVSKALRITGIFIPERYLPELAFSLSFMTSVLIVIALEFLVRRYFVLLKNNNLYFSLLLLISAGLIGFIGFLIFSQIQAINFADMSSSITVSYNLGLGGIQRTFRLNDFSFIFGALVSLSTFIFLISTLFRFPFSPTARREMNG